MTAFAEDFDGSNNTISYSLSDDGGGLFQINENTGEVFVNSSLPEPAYQDYLDGFIDFQQYLDSQIHQIVIDAESSDGSSIEENFDLTIHPKSPDYPDIRNFEIETDEMGDRFVKFEIENVFDDDFTRMNVQLNAYDPVNDLLFSNANGYNFYENLYLNSSNASANEDGYFNFEVQLSDFAPAAKYEIDYLYFRGNDVDTIYFVPEINPDNNYRNDIALPCRRQTIKTSST